MNGDWIEVYYSSGGFTSWYLYIDEAGTVAKLNTVEESIGADPWMEYDELMDLDAALRYVWPDEDAVKLILEYSSKDHTQTLKELGYKGPVVKKCPKCRSRAHEDYLFCPHCGTALQ